jgi:IS605 OrfB family transposase
MVLKVSTLTYCKGLPTPLEELNSLGFTKLEMFLRLFAAQFHKAVCETVNHQLTLGDRKFDKSAWNTYIQNQYGFLKRQANGVISSASCRIDSAIECRQNHIKQLQAKLKSADDWLKKSVKKLNSTQKFYSKRNWQASKTGCNYPLSCCLNDGQTNWQTLKKNIHHKKRYIAKLQKQISHLKKAKLRVKVPKNDVFLVGSKDETWGNQVCQWDGDLITIRVPKCLESQFGTHVQSKIGNFQRKNSRLPVSGAKTWHFYRKDGKWVVAVQFTPESVKRRPTDIKWGCIGIDINPSSIGWAYVDYQGNLTVHGQIPLQQGLPRGQQQAQLVNGCLQLAILADTLSCPVVAENIDFTVKKQQLREKSNRYARMLSGWAYAKFFQLLASILSNRGLKLIHVNPAYSSVLGCVKYLRMYGLASDVAAAIVIARRGMRLSERMPHFVSAYLGVNPRKHVWSGLSKFNTQIVQTGNVVKSRHDYFAISNWGVVVKDVVERVVPKGESRAVSKQAYKK